MEPLEPVAVKELTPDEEFDLLTTHEELWRETQQEHDARWGYNKLATEAEITRRERLRALALEKGGRFTLETGGEIIQAPPPPMLIESWLPGAYGRGSGAVNVMYGAPGAGKTFAALDMALAVATRIPWQGKYPVHPSGDGHAIWIAMESAAAVQWRYKAWCDANSVDPKHPNFMLVRGFAGLHDAKGVPPRNLESLYYRLEEIDYLPSLVVIDTLQAAMAGLDENSVEDMGAVVRAVREMADELACTILLIHHTGKTGAVERGSSYLRGATDGMIHVTNGALKVSRFKEAAFDPDYAAPFTLDSVGDSAVLRLKAHEPAKPARAARASTNAPWGGTVQAYALEAVRELAGAEGVTRAAIGDYVNEASREPVPPMQVTNALGKLVGGGFIRREGQTRNVRYFTEGDNE